MAKIDEIKVYLVLGLIVLLASTVAYLFIKILKEIRRLKDL
jgi:hypothetical protein